MKNIFLSLLLVSSFLFADVEIFNPLGGNRQWKAPVANSAALPASNNTSGDCRAAKDTGAAYCWTGAAWASAGGITTPVSLANGGFGQDMTLSTISTTGTINALAPTTGMVILSGAAPSINGITAPSPSQARKLTLLFTGSTSLTLNPQSVSAAAADRIITPASTFIRFYPNNAVTLVYDDSASRWRFASNTGPLMTTATITAAGILTAAGLGNVTIPTPATVSTGGSITVPAGQVVNTDGIRTASGTPSIDVSAQSLIDSASSPSVRWGNRDMLDSSADVSIDWEGRILKDASAVPSVDWGTRLLKDASDVSSIDWANRTINDTMASPVINWNTFQLVYTGTASLDWGGRSLYDTSGNTSLDWSSRELKDPSNVAKLNWSGSVIEFPNATVSTYGNVGTLNNAPTSGDPVEWIQITVNGNTRYWPVWQ